MKIIFDCLGFSTAQVFVVEGEDHQTFIGYMDNHFNSKFNFCEFSSNYPPAFDMPTASQVVEEYMRQLEDNKNVPCINKEIRKAG